MAGSTPSFSYTPEEILAITTNPSFRITTSLLHDPSNPTFSQPTSLPLTYHQTRLLHSAKAFSVPHLTSLLSGPAGLQHLSLLITRQTASLPSSPHKLTISLSASGTISTTATPALPPLHPFTLPTTPPPPASTLTSKLILATQPTPPSLFTTHKTSHRPMYDHARTTAGISQLPPTDTEVLLYNEHGEVTEASVSTVYFWRKGRWVTPEGRCGGNEGTSRALALAEGWCVEEVMRLEEVGRGEVVALSNGVRGFWFAVVV